MRPWILLAVLSALLLTAVSAGVSNGQGPPTTADFQPPDAGCPEGSLPGPPPITGDPSTSTPGACTPVLDLRGSPLTGGVQDTSPPQGHFAQATGALSDPPPNPGNFIVGTSFRSGTLPVTYSGTFASYLEVYPWYVPEEFDPYIGGMYLTETARVQHGVEFVATYYNSSHDFSPMYPAGIIQIYDWSCTPEFPCHNEAGQEMPTSGFVWDAWLPDAPCWYNMLEDNTGHYVNYLYFRNSTFTVGGDMRRNAVSIWNYCDSVYDGVYTHDFAATTIQDPCSVPGAPCTGYAGFVELFDFTAPPEIVKQGFHQQTLYYDGQVSYLGPDVTTFDNNSPWQQYYLLPNGTWEVGTYQDDDGDDFPNVSVPGNNKPADPDIDGDGSPNTVEVICGATPPPGKTAAWDPYVSEERIDGDFAGNDDDGDTLIDEALPSGAGAFDCDGDGWSGERESGHPLCGNGLNDDRITGGGGGADDSVIDDGCPGGPPQTGYYSEGNFNIGTVDQDPCGSNGWPADLSSAGSSYNRITLADITSFNVPAPAKFGTSPGDPGFNPRWDIVPGPGSGSNPWIQLSDMTSITGGGPTTYPPMLNGVKAFDGPPCPWPP